MARFFVNNENISDGKIRITGDDAFHIARSLRMAVGDSLTVCDEEGSEYLTSLSHIRDDECVAEIISVGNAHSEPPMDITLYMAYPKGDKLEVVVQKAVELGASRIVPFESSRCIKRPAPEKIAKITERLNRIAEEAAKQCGRAKKTVVSTMLRFGDMTNEIPGYDLVLFCYEGDGASSLKVTLEEYSRHDGRVAVIVGSEGGFSRDEADAIIKKGAKCVNLGPRILRCETAPTYCLAAISYFSEL